MHARNLIDVLEPRTLLSNAFFPGDFDGDGDEDVYYSSKHEIWVIEDGVRIGTQVVEGLPSSGYTVRGIGDLNGDRIDDIVVRNEDTNAIGVWLLNDGQASYKLLGSGFGWHPAAIGDVNGDGTDDVIWQNHGNGSVGAWAIANAEQTGWIPLGQANLQDWRLRETADLNGDARADLVWTSNDGKYVGAWITGEGGGNQYRHLGDRLPDWDYVGAGQTQSGAATILWVNRAGDRAGAWEISADEMTFVDLGPVDTAYYRGWQAIGTADVDGNGHSDLIWYTHRDSDVMGAWLIAGQTREYRTVARGSFAFRPVHDSAPDAYTLSQNKTPASVPAGQQFALQVSKANAGGAIWAINEYFRNGQTWTETVKVIAPANPGVFSVGGGPMRVAYDPQASADVELLAVAGLSSRYADGDSLTLQLTGRNHAYNPNTTVNVTFSANDVLGDDDDVAAPAQELRFHYGDVRTRSISITPPLLQGAYHVIVSVEGETGANQWVSPEPVEFRVNPPLELSLHYETGYYLEPPQVDVVLTNSSDLPFLADAPIQISITSWRWTGSILYHAYEQVWSEVRSEEQGFAPGESRTFRFLVQNPGEYFIAEARWPSGSDSARGQVGYAQKNQSFLTPADLDGDGDDDLVYQKPHELEAWILQDGRRVSATVIGPSEGKLIGAGDLDGDSIDELVVNSPSTLVFRFGSEQPIEGWLPQFAPAGYYPTKVGDVNGDGIDDIIWTSTKAPLIQASIRNPDGSFAWRVLGSHDPLNYSWKLHALADVDADGDDDLLWYRYDPTDHGNYVWAGIGGAWLVGDSGPQWLTLPVSGTALYGDFNGDGRTDRLHKQNGQLQVRQMQPDLTTTTHTIARSQEAGWRLVGVADVNDDGTDDLLWRSADHWSMKAELMRDGQAYDWQVMFEPA